jgi:hypothetical protein
MAGAEIKEGSLMLGKRREENKENLPLTGSHPERSFPDEN